MRSDWQMLLAVEKRRSNCLAEMRPETTTCTQHAPVSGRRPANPPRVPAYAESA
jgi:hypothetical protein